MTLSAFQGGLGEDLIAPPEMGEIVPLLRNKPALLHGRKALAPPQVGASPFAQRQALAPPQLRQAPPQAPGPMVEVNITPPPPKEEEKDVPWQEGRETVPTPETDQDRARQDMAIEAKAKLVAGCLDKLFDPVALMEYQEAMVGQSGEDGVVQEKALKKGDRVRIIHRQGPDKKRPDSEATYTGKVTKDPLNDLVVVETGSVETGDSRTWIAPAHSHTTGGQIRIEELPEEE